MRERKYYLKIIGILVLSFIISTLLNGSVFMKNTARIRPNLGKIIISKIVSVPTFLSQIPLPSFKLPAIFNQTQPSGQPPSIENSSLSKISQGVYAEKNNTTSYTLIKEKEIDWKEYSIEIKGSVVKIRVPAGENAPTAEMIQGAM